MSGKYSALVFAVAIYGAVVVLGQDGKVKSCCKTGSACQGCNNSQSTRERILNNTNTVIPTGICFEEVPTISLVRSNNGQIPAGNGSNPSLSRVQVCCKGFKRNEHNFRKCEPVCERPCSNGLCVGPNTCSCQPNFVQNHEGRCIPICPIGCGNGVCDLNLKKCICKDGYELDKGGQFCRPSCKGSCGVGRCVSVNTCVCDEGYTLNKNGLCVAKCERGCKTGTCTGSKVCQCRPGYEPSANECRPICSNGCTNGNCTAPETCTCKPGYKKGSSGNKCEPTCDRPCLNGTCTGPNTCTCHHGYVPDKNDQSRCTIQCSGSSCGNTNKTCTGSGCKCQPGHEQGDNGCKPICSNGCINGNCTAPETCTCKPGYKKGSSGNRCEPTCDQPCLNGTCTGPNKCTCHQGYVPDKTNQFKCTLQCSIKGGCSPIYFNECSNGICTAPDTCTCNPGYTMGPSGFKCEPKCDRPNTCTCHQGYVLDKSNQFKCISRCLNGCPN